MRALLRPVTATLAIAVTTSASAQAAQLRVADLYSVGHSIAESLTKLWM